MPLATQDSPCGSRPGTQDGSSHHLYMTSPQPTPSLSYSSYASPSGESLPPPRDDLSLPPLRDYLQQMASEVLSHHQGTGGNGANMDLSNVDPRLRGVDDEVSSIQGETNFNDPRYDWSFGVLTPR